MNAPADTSTRKPFSVVRYIAQFLIILGVLEVVFLLFVVDHAAFGHYLRGYAALSGELLRLFGEDVDIRGKTLEGANGSIEVLRGCDAFQPIALFCANVFAFPAPTRQRLLGVLAGVPIMLVLNLGRILSLYWLSQKSTDWFEMAHLTIWPVGFIVFSLAMWLVWARWVGAK